jgi:hypothetical protein
LVYKSSKSSFMLPHSEVEACLNRTQEVDGPVPISFTNKFSGGSLTDDPIVARSTVVKAVRLYELRTVVNAVRPAAGDRKVMAGLARPAEAR